jgi:hypothetical protein
MWVPCHHGMAGPQVAGGGDGPHIWRVVTNILNKQSRKADKGWSSSLLSVIRSLAFVALPWMLDLCSLRRDFLWKQSLQYEFEYSVLLSLVLQ